MLRDSSDVLKCMGREEKIHSYELALWTYMRELQSISQCYFGF